MRQTHVTCRKLHRRYHVPQNPQQGLKWLACAALQSLNRALGLVLDSGGTKLTTTLCHQRYSPSSSAIQGLNCNASMSLDTLLGFRVCNLCCTAHICVAQLTVQLQSSLCRSGLQLCVSFGCGCAVVPGQAWTWPTTHPHLWYQHCCSHVLGYKLDCAW